MQAPGLRAKEGEYVTETDKKFTTSDYIIAPKVPQMPTTVVRKSNSNKDDGKYRVNS